MNLRAANERGWIKQSGTHKGDPESWCVIRFRPVRNDVQANRPAFVRRYHPVDDHTSYIRPGHL